MKKAPLFLAILIAAACYIGWSLSGDGTDGDVVISGTIEADDVMLGSKVGGRVVEVLADEGDFVTAGQVLVRLDREQLEADQALAVARLTEAQAQLAELENGSRPEDLAQSQAAVEQSEAALARLLEGSRAEDIARSRAEWQARQADAEVAAGTLARLSSMRTEGVVSPQELDDAQAAADAAAMQAEAARQAYEETSHGPRTQDIEEARAALRAAGALRDRVAAGPRSEEIDAARAAVQQAEAQIARIEVDLDETVIHAPCDSYVEVLDLQPGDLITASRPLATLILPDSLWVRVYMPEDQLGWVHVGEEVEVRVDSWPDEVFRGVIEQINRRAEFTPRNVQTVTERVRQVFGMKVRLENRGDLLRPGMAADVTIPRAAGAGSP